MILETTSLGLCGLVYPSHTGKLCERRRGLKRGACEGSCTGAATMQQTLILFHNGELNLLLPDSGCPLQSGTGHGLPGLAWGLC